jgi:hypothetical protein
MEIQSRVTDQHPQYVQHSPIWEKIETVLAGSDAVKAAANRYLPQSPGHRSRPDLYSAYVDRAMFSAMTSRTLEALTGSIFRKPPTVTVPRQFEPRLRSINGKADTIDTFSRKIAREVLAFGRVGLLTTVAEQPDPFDPLSRLPKIVSYSPSCIRNWRTAYVGAEEVLTQVILSEQSVTELEFGVSVRPGFLVLDLVNGIYRARRFEQIDGGEYVQTSEVIPTDVMGQPLRRIPFVFVGPIDLGADVSLAPMAALADTDLSWFRSSADIESARNKLAFPVPVIIGADDSQTAWALGSDAVWMLPLGASAMMLEFTGQGLGSLENALTQKEATAAMLGARLLAPPKRVSETSDSIRLQHSSETATVSSVAHTVSDGLSRALQQAVAWAGIEGEAVVTLNQDFLDTELASDQLRELRETALAGLLPFDDFVISLQRGELIRSNLSVEEVRSLLETDPIPSAAMPIKLVPSPTAPADQQPAQAQQAAE